MNPLDPASLTKQAIKPRAIHLNVRMSGEEAALFEALRNRTPAVTDSQRVRDALRTALFLMALDETGMPATFEVMEDTGTLRDVNILDHLGVFK